ncbi:MAG: ABC transporter permease [Methanobacterium sp.]|jgi:NitT/TauT family transport system permease protein
MKSENEILKATGESTEIDSSNNTKKFSFDIIGYIKHFTHKWIAVIVFFVLWQIIPSLNPTWSVFIVTPTVIVSTIVNLTVTGILIPNLLASLFRVLTAFGLALVVGLSVGLLLGGFFRNIQKTLDPLLQMISQANPFTLFPIFIAFLGIGEISKIAFIFFVTQWPILFNTVAGITNVDPILVKVAKTAGLGRFAVFHKVLLPASLPTVFTGIRMAAVFSLFMLIGAEMLGATSGLGYMVMQAEGVMNYPTMYAGIVIVALLGIIFMYSITLVEKRLTRWKQEVTY